MLYPPGFYYVKKPKRFVILSSDKSSECNLSCFFDIIKPRRIEHLQKEEPFSSDPYFSTGVSICLINEHAHLCTKWACLFSRQVRVHKKTNSKTYCGVKHVFHYIFYLFQNQTFCWFKRQKYFINFGRKLSILFTVRRTDTVTM